MAPPAAVSWHPSQWWEGDDGSWSSFALRVGNPPQVVRVLPSTAGQQTWAVGPLGCPPGRHGTTNSTACSESRGGLYNPADSTTWHSIGDFSLDLELNLGYDEAASFGLDTVALGFSDSIGGPTIKSQVVSALATDDYYLGIFGLGCQGTNISNFTNPYPSYLTAMREQNLIPSLTWAYTAGAPYQSKGVFGSLTFGGYDNSRFVSNNVSIPLAQDISRDLVVGLQAITSTTVNDTITRKTSLLPSPILTFIDSTIPYIYLPLEACRRFESAFGLYWNETDAMYWVNDTLHETLLSSQANVTFTIGDNTTGDSFVEIVLPYASFDLEVSYPFALETTRYFPLQQATNESQYTLGRAFLQEAYIITDYERSRFSVSQSRFDENASPDLIPILSPNSISKSSPTPSATASIVLTHYVSPNVIIGASIGAASLLLLIIVIISFTVRSRRRHAGQPRNPRKYEGTDDPQPSLEPQALINSSPHEIDHNSLIGPTREVADSGLAELVAMDSSLGHNDVLLASTALPTTEMDTRRLSRDVSCVDTARTRQVPCSARISRSSWADDMSSHTLYAETLMVVESQPYGSEVEIESVATSNLEEEIYSSYIREPLDLDRSIPPI